MGRATKPALRRAIRRAAGEGLSDAAKVTALDDLWFIHLGRAACRDDMTIYPSRDG